MHTYTGVVPALNFLLPLLPDFTKKNLAIAVLSVSGGGGGDIKQ